VAGPTGSTGPTGSGIVSSTTAPGDTSLLWLDTAATAVGVDLDVWTVYTPTWTAATTNPVLGNGSLVGRYKQIGEVVHFTMQLAIGSTTTLGTSYWRFTLPVTAQNTNYLFTAFINDNGTTFYQAMAVGETTSGFTLVVNTLNANSVVVSSTSPLAWTSGDTLTVSGTYEAA
jgi:hypothetical protein